MNAAEHSTGVCVIGYQWRANELLADLGALLQGQSVGVLAGTNIGPAHRRAWFLDRDAGGGILLEQGSHHFDLIRAIGGEVSSVGAVLGKAPLARRGELGEVEDVAAVSLSLESGAVGTVVIAWTKADQPAKYQLDVVASEAELELRLDPEFTLTGTSGGRKVKRRTRRPTRSSGPFTSSSLLRGRAGGQAICAVQPMQRSPWQSPLQPSGRLSGSAWSRSRESELKRRVAGGRYAPSRCEHVRGVVRMACGDDLII